MKLQDVSACLVLRSWSERTEEQPIDCPSLQLYVKKTAAQNLALLDFALLHNTGYCAGFL